MTNQPTAPRKPKARAKKQWNSPLARQAYSNNRRKLAREASEREAKALDDARHELKAAKGRLLQAENTRRTNMVANGLTPRLNAVMNSWGLVMPIKLSGEERISAYTDFEKIVVNYDRRLNQPRLADVEPVSEEALRQIAAETRGLFYHEVGHNLFSTPLADLLTLGWLDGYKSPSVLFPKITNRPSDPRVPEDDPTFGKVWPRWNVGEKFQHAWNVLEDQRMEAALVEESPQIASYLTVLVLRNIVSNSYTEERTASAWGLVAGRKYLPARTRMAARAAWMKAYPTIDADDLADVIDQYLEADTPYEMLAQVEAFIRLTESTAPVTGFDSHGYLEGNNGQEPKDDGREQIVKTGEKASKALAQDDDETDDDEGQALPVEADEVEGDDEAFGLSAQSDDEGDDEGDAEGSNEGSKGSADEDGEPGGLEDDDDDGTDGADDDDLDDEDDEGDEGFGGNGAGDKHQEQGNPAKTAHDDLEDVLDEIDKDQTINDDLAAMNEAYDTDDGSLSVYTNASPQRDEEIVAQAHTVVDDFIRAFNLATADSAPHWESGQRRGVLEPIRYRTRQPGDMEFFRQYTEAGDPGADIAVSVFLDVSGSMEHHVDQLGAAAWASKKACEHIGVDCDVTLFDTSAWKLWGAEETVDEVPTVQDHGGTNPDYAFASMLHDERDKKHHLVLIMTDGQWTGNSENALRNHVKDNMRTMIFNFKKNGQAMEANPKMATKLSADEAYDTGDLYDIPRALESMLISML